ncbi:MAG: hypothetical protein JWR13_27 [Mycobacterium sp.]|nr:hypothetical protein [Mycobacterium sp.]MCW2729211.1 hypothetical protein [Mycobacterium sp.]MDT5316983.1 hypothetical protein [Mycobacterium sp.]
MTGVLLYGYLGGWILTSIVVAVAAWRLQDQRGPAAHPRLMSIVAGAAWPVLVVALAEAGAVALTAEVLHEKQHLLTVDA